MLPDRVSNPGPLTYESGALPIALRGPASFERVSLPREDKESRKNVSFVIMEVGDMDVYPFT